MLSTVTYPGPDINFSPQYIVPVAILAVISISLCTTRIYTRITPKIHLKADDYLILLSQIFSFAGVVCSIVAIAHGWGRYSYYVSPENQKTALKASFGVQLLWQHSMPLVRLSIAASLIPLSRSKIWRSTLWILIGVQMMLYCGWIILTFANCRPLRSFWESVPPAELKCWNANVTLNLAWSSSSFFILMDLIMALMPIQLIRTLNRTRSEKILVSGLMALGLCATAVAGAKISTFPKVHKGDPLANTVNASLLAKLEEQVGLICACLPALKGPSERALVRIGVLSSRFRENMTRPSFVMSIPHRNTGDADSTDVHARESSPSSTDRTLPYSRSGFDPTNTEWAGRDQSEVSKIKSGQTFSFSERTVCNKDSRGTLNSHSAV